MIFLAIATKAGVILTHLDLILILLGSVIIVYPLLFIIALYTAKASKIKYEDAIAIGFSVSAKNHGITLALAIVSIGGLAVIPLSIVPMVQVIMMIGIWKLSPRIQEFFKEDKEEIKLEREEEEEEIAKALLED